MVWYLVFQNHLIQFLLIRILYSRKEFKGSLSILIAKVVSDLLTTDDYRHLNSYVDGSYIYLYDKINFGFALNLGSGLKIGVVSSCNSMEVKEIENRMIELIDKYIDEKLNIDDMSGYTLVLTDLTDQGIDRLSYLTEAIYNTSIFSILALFSFIFFGIIFALLSSYYNNEFKLLSSIVKIILKTFQCVPILLWMLIVMILIGSIRGITDFNKMTYYFIFFGLFSSPALSNLLIEKINQLKNDDFIVALKLLGLNNYRIIFSHIFKYFCLKIILFQVSYIIAHTFFLDITLSWIEQGSSEIVTFGYYLYQSYSDITFKSTNEFYYLTTISFFLTYIFYSIANFYNTKEI